MKKRLSKRMRLSKETLARLDLERAQGGTGVLLTAGCPDPAPETRAFTNCRYCSAYICSDTNCGGPALCA